jgi:hypothetical protein
MFSSRAAGHCPVIASADRDLPGYRADCLLTPGTTSQPTCSGFSAMSELIASRAACACEQCSRRDWLTATFCHLTAAERATTTARRLADIRLVRKVVWRDE